MASTEEKAWGRHALGSCGLGSHSRLSWERSPSCETLGDQNKAVKPMGTGIPRQGHYCSTNRRSAYATESMCDWYSRAHACIKIAALTFVAVQQMHLGELVHPSTQMDKDSSKHTCMTKAVHAGALHWQVKQRTQTYTITTASVDMGVLVLSRAEHACVLIYNTHDVCE